jgi:hypothetical protein
LNIWYVPAIRRFYDQDCGGPAAIALTHKRLVSFDSRTDEHAVAVRAERQADAGRA